MFCVVEVHHPNLRIRGEGLLIRRLGTQVRHRLHADVLQRDPGSAHQGRALAAIVQGRSGADTLCFRVPFGWTEVVIGVGRHRKGRRRRQRWPGWAETRDTIGELV